MINIKNKNTSGFTLVELLVVIGIIGILLATFIPRIGKASLNANRDTVKSELKLFAMNVNQFMTDYGAFRIDLGVENITTKPEYVDYIFGVGAVDNGFTKDSSLAILMKYIQYSCEALDKTTSVKFDAPTNVQSFALQTILKRDPWGMAYRVYINTKNGVILFASAGPDGIWAVTTYSTGQFGDDMLVIVDPKNQ